MCSLFTFVGVVFSVMDRTETLDGGSKKTWFVPLPVCVCVNQLIKLSTKLPIKLSISYFPAATSKLLHRGAFRSSSSQWGFFIPLFHMWLMFTVVSGLGSVKLTLTVASIKIPRLSLQSFLLTTVFPGCRPGS